MSKASDRMMGLLNAKVKTLLQGKQEKWNNAKYAPLKHMSPTDKSSVVEDWCVENCKDIDPNATRNSRCRGSFDITVMGKQVEVRCATEDVSGHFQFNGEIFNRNKEYFMFVGIRPNELLVNVYPASDVKNGLVASVCSMVPNTGKIGSQKLTLTSGHLYDADVAFNTVVRRVLSGK